MNHCALAFTAAPPDKHLFENSAIKIAGFEICFVGAKFRSRRLGLPLAVQILNVRLNCLSASTMKL
jgi:hypothetical protein